MSKLTSCKSCSNEVSKSAKVCPKCGHKLKGGIGKVLLIVLGVFFGLAIIGSMMGDGETTATSVANSGAKQNTDTKADPIFARMSCGEMLEEVGANEASFVRKYKGKTVQVSGIVVSINSSFGRTQVNLSSGDEYDFDSCSIYPNKKAEWPYDLSKGNRITVTCSSVNEIIGSVNLENCVLSN